MARRSLHLAQGIEQVPPFPSQDLEPSLHERFDLRDLDDDGSVDDTISATSYTFPTGYHKVTVVVTDDCGNVNDDGDTAEPLEVPAGLGNATTRASGWRAMNASTCCAFSSGSNEQVTYNSRPPGANNVHSASRRPA